MSYIENNVCSYPSSSNVNLVYNIPNVIPYNFKIFSEILVCKTYDTKNVRINKNVHMSFNIFVQDCIYILLIQLLTINKFE